MSDSGMMVSRQMTMHQGPANLISTKGYSTTMAIATMRKLKGKSFLRRGDEDVSMPACRETHRLFGEGRSKLGRAAATKMEEVGGDYNPKEDTCIKAFVRFLATIA